MNINVAYIITSCIGHPYSDLAMYNFTLPDIFGKYLGTFECKCISGEEIFILLDQIFDNT